MSPQPDHLPFFTWFHKQESCLPEWTSGDLGSLPATTHFLLLSPAVVLGSHGLLFMTSSAFSYLCVCRWKSPRVLLVFGCQVRSALPTSQGCYGSNGHNRHMFLLPEKSESFVVLIIIII